MFTQSRFSVLLLSSLLLSTAVSGCFSSGSDNRQIKYFGQYDGSPGVTPSLSSVKVNFFDIADNYQYIARTKVEFRTGSLSESTTALHGKQNVETVPKGTQQYYLGDGFFTSFPKDKKPVNWIKTDGVGKVNINWQDNSYETPRANQQTLEYIPIDLTGTAGVAAGAPVGIYTLLNELPKTRSQNFTFPKDSSCYVVKNSTEKAYFDFDDTDVTDYQTLEQWKKAQDIQTGYSYQFVPEKVGTSNQIKAVYLVRPEQANDHQSANGIRHSYEAAVLYNNKVYEATYVTAGSNQPATDPKTSLVDCAAYNDGAADFISNKISQYYR